VLGLLLAIGIAFFRDSMDRRLRSPHEIESSLGLPVVGHVRDQVMGQIAHTANGGSDHGVDLEAFRILRRNLEFLGKDRSTRTVLVTSGLPEEGKTTVAGSLAFTMASGGRTTLLVDCDLRRPALAKRLAVTPSPGLSDFLNGKATPKDVMRKVQFSDLPSGNGASSNGSTADVPGHSLVFIPAGSPTSRAAELLSSSRFKEFLGQVSEAYDVVVIDSSPLLPVADTLEMLPYVEAVIVCVRERQTTRDQALAARTALSRFSERPTGVVVTGIDPRHDDDYGNYIYEYGY
jgi:Mrp family chromosome partitioning ATPase